MSQSGVDYYELLGVPRDADRTAIKHAFRARARELHPDVSPDPDAKERFSELARAYSVLSKPASRILYDRFGYLGRGNGGFEAGGPDGAGSAARPGFVDVADLEVDFLEAVRGARRKVSVTAVGTCTACRGDGSVPGSRVERCETCEGEGRVRRSSELGAGRLLQIETCPDCAGRGRVVHEPCPECDGTGRARVERKVDVRIPPGAEDGGVIRVAGRGVSPNGGGASAPADLFVRLRVLPDRDSRLVRFVAAGALVLALALFLVLLATPEALL